MTIGLTWRRTARRIKRLKDGGLTISPDYSDLPTPDFLTLSILYGSFIHPLTTLSGLPSAGVGALVTLMLFREDLSVYGFVGILMLIGIVKKNAIMMIDFAIEAERHGAKAPRGIHCGGLSRPVSSYHDDNVRRADGGSADYPGLRCRGRVASAFGPGRRRRSPLLANPDALYHTSGLSLHGSSSALV